MCLLAALCKDILVTLLPTLVGYSNNLLYVLGVLGITYWGSAQSDRELPVPSKRILFFFFIRALLFSLRLLFSLFLTYSHAKKETSLQDTSSGYVRSFTLLSRKLLNNLSVKNRTFASRLGGFLPQHPFPAVSWVLVRFSVRRPPPSRFLNIGCLSCMQCAVREVTRSAISFKTCLAAPLESSTS